MREASSELSFHKVEGAGNDFVLVDGRTRAVSWTPETIRTLCDRRRGVGGDGLLYVEETTAGTQAGYWNSDGGAADFCGNGARCVAAFLDASGVRGPWAFRLGAVSVRARKTSAHRYRVDVASPAGRDVDTARLDQSLADHVRRAALVDAGVGHLVLLADATLFREDARIWGPPHRRFALDDRGGVNVDLLHETGGDWRVRTFERGVEDETLCCGSALLAAGWCLERWGLAKLPVDLVPTGGDQLVVGNSSQTGRTDGEWFLEGPARIVYRGTIAWPAGPNEGSSPRDGAARR